MNLLDDHPSKMPSSDGKLHRWKSWRGNTMFAPIYDIPIYIDFYDDKLSSKLVKVLSQRKAGYKLDKVDSNGNNYQRQWSNYNIFDWKNEEIKILADKIYTSYVSFCRGLNKIPLEKDMIWIRGWAVVLEDNQAIEFHSHSFHENTFLSGNLSLSDLGTTTDYWFPNFSLYFGWWKSENKIGSLTLFPSWLEHKVDPNLSGKLRYSIAFDLFTKHSLDYIQENRIEGSENQEIILLAKNISEV
jgi:hypothetical protein